MNHQLVLHGSLGVQGAWSPMGTGQHCYGEPGMVLGGQQAGLILLCCLCCVKQQQLSYITNNPAHD